VKYLLQQLNFTTGLKTKAGAEKQKIKMCSKGEHFERINLKPKREYEDGNQNDQHFMVAESRFHRMMALSNISSQSYKIDSVDLLKNQKLWDKFTAKQEEFRKAGKNSKPLMIFHGTPGQNVDSIVKDNFTVEKIANGRVYGDGVYFSECPEISIMYSRGTKQLLLCQVLLGNTTTGKLAQGFDSTEVTRRDTGEQRCYAIVVPDVDQIYPCYVIHFSDSRNTSHTTQAGVCTNTQQPNSMHSQNQMVHTFSQRRDPMTQGLYNRYITRKGTRLVAGHYRLRKQEEFSDQLAGLQKERSEFARFLIGMGLPHTALQTLQSLTNMYIREEMVGGESIYVHHRTEAGENVCTEVITPGVQTIENSEFNPNGQYSCQWVRSGDCLTTTLVKQCQPVGSVGIPFSITREFRDKTLSTRYTAYATCSGLVQCELIYIKMQ